MINNLVNDGILESEAKFIAPAQKIPYTPVAIERGKGALLYDYAGNAYIDMLASASSTNIGHGNVEIAEAVKAQMEKISQYTLVYFPMKEPVELADRLAKLSGREDMAVAFSGSGSASIDGAIKFARGFTGRTKIVSFLESYHGSTYGAISISALNTNMRRKIGPLIPDIYHIHYPNCLRCPYSKKECSCELECLGELTYAFDHYLPAEEVAGVFMEPIAGDAGLIVPPVRYVKALHALCREHGILFISDEIQQGLGRTGRMFAMDHFGVESDMYVMGKSLGAGLPMGAIVGRGDVMRSLEAPAHVFTLQGCSAVCAGTLKMLEIMEREKLNEASIEKGAYLKEKLLALQKKHDIIGDVRGMALSIGVELVKNRDTMEKDYAAAAKVSYRCMEKGVLLTFVGQSTLRVQPPLVITYAQMDTFVEILDSVLCDFEDGKISDDILDQVKGW